VHFRVVLQDRVGDRLQDRGLSRLRRGTPRRRRIKWSRKNVFSVTRGGGKKKFLFFSLSLHASLFIAISTSYQGFRQIFQPLY
jgi:hypothetical protein